jgi:hypothetical protein
LTHVKHVNRARQLRVDAVNSGLAGRAFLSFGSDDSLQGAAVEELDDGA